MIGVFNLMKIYYILYWKFCVIIVVVIGVGSIVLDKLGFFLDVLLVELGLLINMKYDIFLLSWVYLLLIIFFFFLLLLVVKKKELC